MGIWHWNCLSKHVVPVGVEFRGPGHFKNFSEHPTRLTYEALQQASVVTDTKNPQLVKLTSGTGPILIF